MPIIKFTTALAERMGGQSGIISTTSSAQAPAFARPTPADSTVVSRIRIMSGPIPLQSEIDVAYPTWDRFTGSPTEILIDLQTRDSSYFGVSGDIIIWDLLSAVADTGGTASWWIWSGNMDYDPLDRGAAPGAPNNKWLPCIVGNITEPGDGGSMTLASLIIVAGQTYDIGPATFVMPRTYTYV
jgi:hypothetical protein